MNQCRVSYETAQYHMQQVDVEPVICRLCKVEELSEEAISLGLTCCSKCIRPSCKGIDGDGCPYMGYTHPQSEVDLCARCEYVNLCTLDVGDFVSEEDMESECELWAERAGIVHQKKPTLFSKQPRLQPTGHFPQPITELQFAGLCAATLLVVALMLLPIH